LKQLSIAIEGERVDAVPSPFKKIKLVFEAQGEVDDHKLQRAVQLAVEKYCSVRASMDPGIEITWEARLLSS
jgi:putative redox protein